MEERPVVFQKYFRSGRRTYASQVMLASSGKRYLVLTEGRRDRDTQEVQKRTIRIFEQDLKDFFAMLQETVLYLRSHQSDEERMPLAFEIGPEANPEDVAQFVQAMTKLHELCGQVKPDYRYGEDVGEMVGPSWRELHHHDKPLSTADEDVRNMDVGDVGEDAEMEAQ